MTYWNETDDTHIRFWDTPKYDSYYKIKDEINIQGYRGDILQPSEVIYLGSCDIMNLFNGDIRWAYRHHQEFYPDQPFIALGAVGSGLPTMVRKLYSYIQNFGAPKSIYMSVPRFDGREYVNESGKCYNVSSRTHSANFCQTAGLVDDEEHAVWMSQLLLNRSVNNPNNIRYILEERFAFIETLCKMHNISLTWTFNLSDASIVILNDNIEIFKDISIFMKNSFIGLAQVKDLLEDRSIAGNTHRMIYDKFINPEKWDYDKLRNQAEINYGIIKNTYKTNLIKQT
jgi:hypothetical protein